MKLLISSIFGIAALIIGVSRALRPDEFQLFWQHAHLWINPVIAGMTCGLLMSVLGVYLALNRMVFVSLAVGNASGFGILAVLLAGAQAGLVLESSPLILLGGISFSLLAWSLLTRAQMKNREAGVALLFVGASAGNFLLSDFIPEGRHTVDHLLFGNAVSVTATDLNWMIGISISLLLILYFYRKQFLYVSIDPLFLKVSQFPVGVFFLLLQLLVTIGITSGLSILGMLPVFALLFMPVLWIQKRTQNLTQTFVAAGILGALWPFLGYLVSYLFSLPTGPTIVGVAFLFLPLFWVKRSLNSKAILR